MDVPIAKLPLINAELIKQGKFPSATGYTCLVKTTEVTSMCGVCTYTTQKRDAFLASAGSGKERIDFKLDLNFNLAVKIKTDPDEEGVHHLTTIPGKIEMKDFVAEDLDSTLAPFDP